MATVKSKKPTKAPSKKLKAGKKKSLNKWLLLGGVATAVIAGVVIVRFSSAANYTFIRYRSQMSGGAGSWDKKDHYPAIGAVTTLLTSGNISQSRQICTHWDNGAGGDGTLHLEILDSNKKVRMSNKMKIYRSNKTGNLCLNTGYPRTKGFNAVARVRLTDYYASSLHLNTIYGK